MEEGVKPPVEPVPVKSERVRNKKLWAVLGTAFLCFAASFLGAWLFVGSGIIKLDASRTISDNASTIVAQQGEVIADVFKKVSPSTVAITTQSVSNVGRGTVRQQISEGAGSGVIISKDGYIITNKHVVPAGVNKVNVITDDGKEYENVKVIGRDPNNDLAFLKVDGVDDLKPAAIGDSAPVRPGQQVVAVGNALGIFRNSVTSGIISGTGRPLTAAEQDGSSAEQLEDMFQTDAAINPGNSGGPLVNLKGEVIGINTAVSTDGQGIGFAIPINAAKAVINSVLTKGKVIKAYLGVRYASVTAEIADELKLPVKEGALVGAGRASETPVVSGSPAAAAGLKNGDIITKVNATKIVMGKGLSSLLAQYSPGDKVELTYVRDGKEQKVTVTLTEYPQ